MTIPLSPQMQAVCDSLTVNRDELLKRAADQARWIESCLADGDRESWMPHLTVFRKPNARDPEQEMLFALAVDFNTDRDKHQALTWAGRQVARAGGGPTCAFLSAEAWTSSNIIYGGGALRPEHDPKRREVITIQGMTMMHPQCVCLSAPVARIDGKIASVKFGGPENLTVKRLRLIEWFVAGYMDGIAAKHAAQEN